ncbi:hypothetical protein E2C01_030965 [Portunus trituberculatus]|uniref:Uncharacterized protein n=1 Tax=Portunus trituberculatus TaxID=210409 RepID=A0A5B7EVL6_PORTR|nr:hypothetical protein [Portunus trituberculatus]
MDKMENLVEMWYISFLSTAADTSDRPKEGCSDRSSGIRARSRKMEASRRLQNTASTQHHKQHLAS